MQDLQCRKCGGVKELNMPLHCTCAGAFRTMSNRGDLVQTVRTFVGIARHYDMKMLAEVVQWHAGMAGIKL